MPEIQNDILVKVLKFQKWLRQSGPGGTDWDFETSSLGQNFEAVLAVVVKLAGEAIFTIFCQDTLKHLLRHPFRQFPLISVNFREFP